MRFKSFLEEAVLDIDKMGLYHAKDERMVILYKPTNSMKSALNDWDPEGVENDLLAVARYAKEEGFLYIKELYAQKGFGPLLYLTIMTLSGNQGLSSSPKPGLVSAAAESVWTNFYRGKGKDLVEKEFIKQIHKNPALNYKYRAKRPVNVKEGQEYHEAMFQDDSHGELLTFFVETADARLREEMDKVYGN